MSSSSWSFSYSTVTLHPRQQNKSVSLLQFWLYSWCCGNTTAWRRLTQHLLRLLAVLDAVSNINTLLMSVGLCVFASGGVQVNSLRGPTVPRASLAHHLTCHTPMKAYAQMNLLSKIERIQNRERERKDVAAPAKLACCSAQNQAYPYPPPTFGQSVQNSLCDIFSDLSVSVSVSVSRCRSPSLSCRGSCNAIV